VSHRSIHSHAKPAEFRPSRHILREPGFPRRSRRVLGVYFSNQLNRREIVAAFLLERAFTHRIFGQDAVVSGV